MSRVWRTFRWVGRLIKFLFFCVIFGVIALLLWRVFSSKDPDSMKPLTPNEKLCTAYEEAGEDLYLFRQEQRSITSGEKNYGYFSVTDAVFVPSANQIQMVVRYNNSTLRSLTEDYGLSEVPSREQELFDFSLVLATDLTPDNADDNLGNAEGSVAFTRILPSSATADTKNLYNYRRVVFDLDTAGLSLQELLDSGLLLAVYADIYYNEAIDYDQEAYGTLCLYDYITEIRPGRLEKEDIRALDAYLGKE